MFDHQFIINTIIENNGIIIGGYIREWLGNGKPMDFGWNDIDIRCDENSKKKIKKEIDALYPNLKLDFSPSEFSGYRSPYTCNLIQYDGEFKTVKYIGEKDYVNLTKNKECIFLKQTGVGRKLNFEKRLINDGWKIEFPYLLFKFKY
jgi:hypothetical protein